MIRPSLSQVQYKDGEGRLYYLNERSGESRWECPMAVSICVSFLTRSISVVSGAIWTVESVLEYARGQVRVV